MNGVLSVMLAGAALGWFFYGGLWWTVRRLPITTHPVLLTIASYWARLVVVLGAFFLLAKSGWARVAIALASFLLARLIVSRWIATRRIRCT